jgi:hypothetical protein
MQSKELRIGNWISHTPSKNETTDANFIVSEINMFDGNTINGLESEDCEPIPLTEKLFLKFGFEKRDSFFEHWNFGLSIYKDGNYFESDQLPMFIKLQYVHQLQNLYFALTGEELELKHKSKP